MFKYENILRYVTETNWAILPSKLAEIRAVLRDHAKGDPEVIEARIKAFKDKQAKLHEHDLKRRHTAAGIVVGDVGIIPIVGTMARRMNLFMEFSGGASTAMLAQQVEEMAADPSIKGILLDIDSPGGAVDGTPELGAVIAKAAQHKHIVAHANGLAASAAFWIATQASELSVEPSGFVGSIGVLSIHEDFSEARESEGVKTTIVKSAKFKAEGNPFEPLSEEAKAERQRIVDDIGKQFHAAVAAGRGVSVKKVREQFGQGRVIMADEAKALGMVDRVETINEALSRLLRKTARANGKSARAEMSTVRDFETFLRDEGEFSRSEAKSIASGGFKAALDGVAAVTRDPWDGDKGQSTEETGSDLSAEIESFLKSVK